MESSILSAAQGFNLKCSKSKIYKDKFGHVCITARGPVRIQRTGTGHVHGQNTHDNGIEAILFQHEIKEHLHKNGFIVDRFLISSRDAPYFRAEVGDVYTACLVQTGPNIDFTDALGFLDAVKHVAKMHQTLLEASFIAAPAKKAKTKIDCDAAKLLGNLTSLKKKLLKTGKFSDFDMLFLRGYEMFAPHIVNAGDACNDEKHICHNLLKEENIYRQANGQIAITNFSEASKIHYLHDVAYIIKRYIKAKPHEIMPIGKILEEYASHCQISLDDRLFSRILLYPDKFIKVTIDYYSKKRSFAPNTYISRMQECLRVGAVLSERL